ESKGSEVASEPGGVEPNAAEGRHEKAGYGRVVVADHREFARYTQALADRGAQDECGGVVVEGSDAGDPGSAPLAHDETRGRLLDNGVLEPHPRIRTRSACPRDPCVAHPPHTGHGRRRIREDAVPAVDQVRDL